MYFCQFLQFFCIAGAYVVTLVVNLVWELCLCSCGCVCGYLSNVGIPSLLLFYVHGRMF